MLQVQLSLDFPTHQFDWGLSDAAFFPKSMHPDQKGQHTDGECIEGWKAPTHKPNVASKTGTSTQGPDRGMGLGWVRGGGLGGLSQQNRD